MRDRRVEELLEETRRVMGRSQEMIQQTNKLIEQSRELMRDFHCPRPIRSRKASAATIEVNRPEPSKYHPGN